MSRGGRVLVVVVALALGGCGSGGASTSSGARASTTASPARTAATSGSGASHSATASTPDGDAPGAPPPGTLPQTDQLPSADTAVFHAEMNALWRAVVANSVTAGLPAFFPKPAYLQVKAISDAAADYENRLVGGYAEDIAAAHALLEPDPSSARLIGVQVPQDHAHWVVPNTCYNRIGYYEVPNSRVVYRQGGAERSFGIASLISWRGVWYVVHFGSVLSPGTVDDPSTGPGVSAPSSTC